MSYALRILPAAEKQLSKLDSPAYDAVKARILELSNNPRPPGCKKLRGREGWRVRAGDYRIVYEIDDKQRL